MSKPTYEELEAQLHAVVAENVALKAAITDHSQSVHFCEVCGKDDPCSTDDVCYVLSETPATDAILASLRAEGVDMFAEWQTELAYKAQGDLRHAYVGSVKDANIFAAQLRQSVQVKGVQS